MDSTIPEFKTDEEAEEFLHNTDFSQYIEAKMFQPVRFEFKNKDKQVNLRMPGDLLDSVKKRAEEMGIPYQRYIRHVLEASLNVNDIK